MSKFESYQTTLCDEDCLIQALQDNGFEASQIEVHKEAVNLYGYRGDVRPEKAHIVIRRKHIGAASNDIGFVREDGKFRAVISEFDSNRQMNKTWLSNVQADHDKHRVVKILKEKGYKDIAVEKVEASAGRKKYRIQAAVPPAKLSAGIGLKK